MSSDTDPLYSVVVPTFNGRDTLPEVLAALAQQRDAPSFEVIVVDDGSTDGTSEWLDQQIPDVRVLTQANQGPAAARNHGVLESSGRWVAFLGDDTIPEAAWLANHHRARQRPSADQVAAEGGAVAVIGYTAWHPRMRLNPFLRYINEHGLQFGYALIEDHDNVPFNFLYTSNLSLPRQLLLEEPFDLGFPYAAWEDIEVSYRLGRRGLRLLYAPDARVAHDHPTTIARFCQRQERAGYCAVVFYQRHPELGGFLGLGADGPPPLPNGSRQRWRELLARALEWTPARLPTLWEDVLRYHYIRGLHRGWAETAGHQELSADGSAAVGSPAS